MVDQFNKEMVDKVFNRLRARLYNMVEQLQLDDTQMTATKASIRDCTSSAWNDIGELVEKVEG